jgi:hypothetical protein
MPYGGESPFAKSALEIHTPGRMDGAKVRRRAVRGKYGTVDYQLTTGEIAQIAMTLKGRKGLLRLDKAAEPDRRSSPDRFEERIP